MIRKMIVLFMLFIISSMFLCQCRTGKKVLPTTSTGNQSEISPSKKRIEQWEINVPEKEFIQPEQSFTYVLATVQDARVQVFEKYVPQKEFRILDYINAKETAYLLSVALSPDRRFVACYSQKGLVVIDLEKEIETLLEENPATVLDTKDKPPYSYYITDIRWSFDNRYLFAHYIGFEASSGFVFDVAEKRKISPSGTGILSGYHMDWSPNQNRFIEASSDFAYGKSGLYLSSQNDVGQYTDISQSLGLERYLFYQAVFSPDSQHISFISSAQEADFETMSADSAHMALWICKVDHPEKEEIYKGEIQNTLFYHPTGNQLYYVLKEPGKINIKSYDINQKTHQNEATLLSDRIDLRSVIWLDNDRLMLEIIRWNSDSSFKNTQIIGLDLLNQSLFYASAPFQTEIKLLSCKRASK